MASAEEAGACAASEEAAAAGLEDASATRECGGEEEVHVESSSAPFREPEDERNVDVVGGEGELAAVRADNEETLIVGPGTCGELKEVELPHLTSSKGNDVESEVVKESRKRKLEAEVKPGSSPSLNVNGSSTPGISEDAGEGGAEETLNKKAKKKALSRPKSSRKGAKKASARQSISGNNNVEDDVLPVTPAPLQHQLEDREMVLSLFHKAGQVMLSDDRLSATCWKGYRMVRATRGVMEGAWYFEISIEHLGKTGHTRLGWCTQRGDVQAPVGYDSNSYAYRDLEGCKVHQARREPYGEMYGEGDTIGFYISLPGGAELAPRPRQLVRWKGQPYYIDDGEGPKVPVPGSEIAFFRNGVCQGSAYTDIFAGRYYPAASIYTLPEQTEKATVRFNFGPDFKYPPTDMGGRPLPQPMSEAKPMEPAMLEDEAFNERPGAVRVAGEGEGGSGSGRRIEEAFVPKELNTVVVCRVKGKEVDAMHVKSGKGKTAVVVEEGSGVKRKGGKVDGSKGLTTFRDKQLVSGKLKGGSGSGPAWGEQPKGGQKFASLKEKGKSKKTSNGPSGGGVRAPAGGRELNQVEVVDSFVKRQGEVTRRERSREGSCASLGKEEAVSNGEQRGGKGVQVKGGSKPPLHKGQAMQELSKAVGEENVTYEGSAGGRGHSGGGEGDSEGNGSLEGRSMRGAPENSCGKEDSMGDIAAKGKREASEGESTESKGRQWGVANWEGGRAEGWHERESTEKSSGLSVGEAGTDDDGVSEGAE